MPNKSVDDIYGYAQDLLKIDGEDIGVAGLESDRTILFVADLDKQLDEEFYSRRMVLPEYRRGSYGTDSLDATALNGAVLSGAATITVDSTTGFASAGAAVIYDNNQFDLFTYTGKTATTFTGVSGIDFDHEDNLSVESLYSLPATFGRMRPSRKSGITAKNHDGVQVDGAGYLEVPEFPSGRQFSVYTSGDNSYLWLPRGTDGQIMVSHDTKPNTITTAESLISYPDPYHLYHVWGLVALFRQVLDEDYVPQKENAAMQKVVNQVLAKRSSGKIVRASNAFFGRGRL
jgi:hypothetical protein